MKRKLRLSIKIIISILIILVILISVYGYNLSSVSSEKAKEEITFEIKKGETIDKIINNLKESNLIRSTFFTKLHVKFSNLNNLKAGIYKLDNSKSTNDILDAINSGKAINNEEIKITFPEGKNMRGVAKIIANNTNNKEEDVFKLNEDKDYIKSLKKEYWFITNEIDNDELYYPLEGYLSMNTYIFKNKDVPVKDIFKKMLDQTNKLLTKYKADIEDSTFTIHEILTLASIAQSEGIDLKSMGIIAGVFYNRYEKKMPFQSCVTACYGTKEDDCVPKKVANLDKNPYNTYLPSMAGKLPVGPVSSFGEDALKAAIKPDKTDYLFFISDIKNKLYFSKTNAEHERMKNELINKGIFFR